ncbi:MAG TPA: helix-turn-helix transcriptional regulator [Acidimicrobiales bacterium]
MTGGTPTPSTVGERIRRYRQEKATSLSRLARDAGVSKSYLWRLENPPENEPAQRPSGKTLYAIAKALGVTMSDLLGEELILHREATVDPSLRRFAADDGLPQADVDMLASIEWRGDRPRTVERWRYIYQAIVMSRSLDDRAAAEDPGES